jgi:hypothetical protein
MHGAVALYCRLSSLPCVLDLGAQAWRGRSEDAKEEGTTVQVERQEPLAAWSRENEQWRLTSDPRRVVAGGEAINPNRAKSKASETKTPQVSRQNSFFRERAAIISCQFY